VNNSESRIVGVKAVEIGAVWQNGERISSIAYQVLECCDMDLHTALYIPPQGQRNFTEGLAHFFFCQIVEGALHLNKHKVYSRDLKLENVLLVRDVCVKITDFGMGTDKSRTDTLCTQGRLEVNMPINMPPWDFRWKYDTAQLEVFGCGFILLQLCYVDSFNAHSLRRPWTDKLYSGKTFEEQCNDSREPQSKHKGERMSRPMGFV